MYTDDIPVSSDISLSIDEKTGDNFEKITEATTSFVDGFHSLPKIRNTLIFLAGILSLSLCSWAGYQLMQVHLAKESMLLKDRIFIARSDDSDCLMFKIQSGQYKYVVEKRVGIDSEMNANISTAALFKELPTIDLTNICSKLKK